MTTLFRAIGGIGAHGLRGGQPGTACLRKLVGHAGDADRWDCERISHRYYVTDGHRFGSHAGRRQNAGARGAREHLVGTLEIVEIERYRRGRRAYHTIRQNRPVKSLKKKSRSTIVGRASIRSL